MQTVSTLAKLRSARPSLSGTVGLVPTMGYLHEGHLSLVRRAKEDCDRVVVSIFVNPTQFGPNEDLSRYPRDLDRDLMLLRSLGTELVWIPTAEMMYPSGYQTWVEVEAMTRPLEGAMRPGHFRGVTTVVAKLFNGVQPQRVPRPRTAQSRHRAIPFIDQGKGGLRARRAGCRKDKRKDERSSGGRAACGSAVRLLRRL